MADNTLGDDFSYFIRGANVSSGPKESKQGSSTPAPASVVPPKTQITTLPVTTTALQGISAPVGKDQIPEAICKTGENIFRQFLAEDPTFSNNLTFSPLTAHCALSVASTGSTGDARKNLTSLTLSDPTSGKEFYKQFIKQLPFANALQMTNTVNSEVPLGSKFVGDVQDNFQANVTQGTEIQGSISLGSALRFNQLWRKGNKFPPGNTHSKEFFLSNGEEINIPTMWGRELENVGYKVIGKRDERIDVLKLPYKDGYSAIVAVPRLHRQSEHLMKIDWKDFIKDNFEPHSADIFLPKLSLDNKLDLVTVIKKMGAESLFEFSKDFTPMLPEGHEESKDTKIESITQDNTLNVHEAGTDATSKTEVKVRVMDCASASEKLPRCMVNVNKPFMFFVVDDRTNVPALSSFVADPRKK